MHVIILINNEFNENVAPIRRIARIHSFIGNRQLARHALANKNNKFSDKWFANKIRIDNHSFRASNWSARLIDVNGSRTARCSIFPIVIPIRSTFAWTFAGQKALARHRTQWFAPEFHGRKEFVVGNAIRAIAGRIDEWIDHTGRPCQYRCDRIDPRILVLIVEKVDDSQWQEAQQKANENCQHHGRQAWILAFTCRWQCHRFRRWPIACYVFVQFLALPSHCVVDARIRCDDHYARQQESHQKQELLNRFAIFLEYCARECGLVKA